MVLSMIKSKKKHVSELDIIVGLNLRANRARKRVSQEKLGQGVGLTYQQIQKQETGKNRITAARALEYSIILDIPLQDLFVGVEEIARKKIQERMNAVE